MTAFQFADCVHAALVGGDLVLLDLASDGYACLPSVSGDVSAPLVSPAPLPADALDALATAGAVQRCVSPGPRPAPPAPASTDLRNHPVPKVGLLDWIDALAALAALRRVGLDSPVAQLTTLQRPATGEGCDPATVKQASAAFAQMLPWLPVRNQCLHRSALLAAFLARRGLAADWVFGVRTWPFRAHCWLQSGDVCLNDDAERLRSYMPIYAVR